MENRVSDGVVTELDSTRSIAEAIRLIAFRDRLRDMDVGFTHGFVSKLHDDAGDELFGTVDVTEYRDSNDTVHEGVFLSAIQQNGDGVFVIPTLGSEVSILCDRFRNWYVVKYSHADRVVLNSHKEVSLGVTETEDWTEDEQSADFDELAATGNSAQSVFTADGIESVVKNKDGKESAVSQSAASIEQMVDNAMLALEKDKTVLSVGSMSVSVGKDKVTLGADDAKEPVVLGNELADVLLDFIGACEQIKIATMLGTMVPLNLPSFIALKAKVQTYKASVSGFLSKKVKTV